MIYLYFEPRIFKFVGMTVLFFILDLLLIILNNNLVAKSPNFSVGFLICISDGNKKDVMSELL